MAQQILKEADGAFKSFFGLIKLAKQGKYNFRDIKLPGYLPKDGHMTLVIGMVRLNENLLTIPYSRSFSKAHAPVTFKIPPLLAGKSIKEIRIIPKSKAKFFEIQYTYEVAAEQRKLNPNKAMAVDFGLSNLAACATSDGKMFIVDGKRLKSVNQWFNKENARLQSVKDKQDNKKRSTNRQRELYAGRNNKINDYILKAARIIINRCISWDIGTLAVGYSETLQRGVSLGKITNQQFANIPLGRLKDKLEYLCKLYGIRFVKQEESYTSQASFFDGDEIPEYNADNPKSYKFTGRRTNRGLYGHNRGLVNADVNGALNILRKSKAVDLSVLGCRGEVDTPVRMWESSHLRTFFERIPLSYLQIQSPKYSK